MLSTILIIIGVFLVLTWVGTRNKMKKEGTWNSEGGGGAYITLAIYLGIIGFGIFI